MIVVSVMYRAGEPFDEDYYVTRHLPLVRERWGTLLAEARVLRGIGAPGGGEPAYAMIAELGFPSRAAMEQAMAGPHAAEILADIARFTPAQPVIQISEAIG